MYQLKAPLKALGFAVMMATASMSNAATTDWGTVAPGTTFSESLSVPRVGAFEDIYSFSLLTSAVGDLKRSVTLTLDQFGLPESGFLGLTYGLYSSLTDTLLSYSGYDLATKKYLYSEIAAGDYYLKIAGTGWKIGDVDLPKYNALVSITAAPAPEPQTYAMLLAGLGILGTVVRRRSRDY